MSKKCSKCSGADFTPGGNCRACQKVSNAAYRLKHSGGGSTVKTKVKEGKPAEVSAPAPAAVLQIEQGYGLKAWIDDPYLMIEQREDENKTDAICLSRTELRQLLEKFGSWAA